MIGSWWTSERQAMLPRILPKSFAIRESCTVSLYWQKYITHSQTLNVTSVFHQKLVRFSLQDSNSFCYNSKFVHPDSYISIPSLFPICHVTIVTWLFFFSFFILLCSMLSCHNCIELVSWWCISFKISRIFILFQIIFIINNSRYKFLITSTNQQYIWNSEWPPEYSQRLVPASRSHDCQVDWRKVKKRPEEESSVWTGVEFHRGKSAYNLLVPRLWPTDNWPQWRENYLERFLISTAHHIVRSFFWNKSSSFTNWGLNPLKIKCKNYSSSYTRYIITWLYYNGLNSLIQKIDLKQNPTSWNTFKFWFRVRCISFMCVCG